MIKKKLLFLMLILVRMSVCAEVPQEFRSFPIGSDPGFIGSRLAQRYLSSSQSTSPVGYPEVCTWFGALRFAGVSKDTALLRQLENRFIPILGDNSGAMQTPNHVDKTVFGIVPLQLYQQTGKQVYYNLGIDFADRQWTLPTNPDPANVEKYNALYESGLSWQTRFWIDDMFMITAIQSQAYLASKDLKYINRAAHEMTVYLDSLQRPNGLFYHFPTAPFFWCRGNGWMAVGMADVLTYLPENNPDRPKILQGYRKMMATLKSYQTEGGLWRQLVDQSDAWTETSGSAMYTYAMAMGVKNGLLDAAEYAPAVRKAWFALVANLNDDWPIRDVCIGTNVGYTKDYYMARERVVGDLHGQAAVLWCATALYDAETNSATALSSLKYDFGTLSPAFSPDITEYTCKVPAGITSVTPQLIPSYRAKITSGSEVVTLNSGTASSTITVSSEDGLISKVYKVNFVVGNDVNMTNLIVNNDFELAPDANCQPVTVAAGVNGWDASGSIPCWRLSKSSCSTKQFYGWTHNQSLLGTSTSQGINADGVNKHGNWVGWIGGNKTGLTEFEFSQTINSNQLQPGTYKVQCLMAIGKNGKRVSQRLFANNNVQYFGPHYKYAENKTASENNSFAGYPEFFETNLKEMAVYATIGTGQSLKIGIRTNSMEGDGDIATQSSPMFKMDYFRLVKIAAEDAADASLAQIKLSSGSMNFTPTITVYNVMLPAGVKSVSATAFPNIQDVNVTGMGNVDVSSGSGTTTILVTALDGKTTKTYTINYTVQEANGVDDIKKPSIAYFVNDRKLTVKGIDFYALYNVNGVKVAAVNNVSEVSVALIPGVYIVKTKNAGVFKVIVK